MVAWARYVLAFRGAGLLLIAMGLPKVVFVSTDLWWAGIVARHSGRLVPPVDTGVLLTAFTRASPSLMAIAAGLYLLLRPAPLLLRPFSAKVSHE